MICHRHFLVMLFMVHGLLSSTASARLQNPELEMMQAIEPRFVPNDERTFELFSRERAIKAAENEIKNRAERARNASELFTRKFHDELRKIADKKASPLEAKRNRAVGEIISRYENVLKAATLKSDLEVDVLYDVGRFYFEEDEKKYLASLARYNAAREQGRDDIPYPEENFQRTIETYTKIKQRYPNFRYMDSVHFLLGLSLWYEGAFYNAVAQFEALIQQFPASRFADEVRFRLGEFLYDLGRYDDAIKSYETVAQNPKSKFYDKAIYKIAWAHYQKDRYAAAIDNFVQVLALTYLEKGEGAAAGMRAEVTRYIVKSFSEQALPKNSVAITKKRSFKAKPKSDLEYDEFLGTNLVERISNHFKALNNPPYTRDVQVEAAGMLVDELKIDGGVLALQRVIELDVNHHDNPRFASEIAGILEEGGRLDEARRKNHELIENYGERSQWYRSQPENSLARKFARDAVRDAILGLAVYYHKTGKELKDAKQEKKAEDNFKQASVLYARYVREYLERDDTHKAIFYFAEASYELKQYRDALDAYQLLKEYPLPLPDNFRRDATFNIVFTLRHILESEAKEQRFKAIDFDNVTSKQRGLVREEIPELGKQYLASIDDFLSIAPDDELVPVLLFHAAAIYYAYGQSDESRSRFFFIIDTYPKTDAAAVSARLIIDDAVANEEWALVAELAQRFMDSNLGNQKSDFARILGNARFKIARSVFEQALALQKANQRGEARAKFKESSELFTSLLTSDPKNPYADVMLFNAARAMVLSGAMVAAMPLYKKIYTEFPKSEYAKSARFQEALALEKMLKFKEAAAAYEAIAKADPNGESAGDAMLNKALLYEAADDMPLAAAAFTDFAQKYPRREEAPEAFLTAAAIYKRMGKTTQQVAMLEQFIRQYKNDRAKIANVIEAQVLVADTYAELQKGSSSAASKRNYEKARLLHLKDAVALQKRAPASPVASFYAAKAQLMIEAPEQEAFIRMNITARTGKAQGQQLTSMMKRLTELSARNEAVIRNYAQPVWNAEALRRIGRLYEHLAKTMLASPCPRDVEIIDEYACDEYLVLLEDKAAILEEKSLTAYRQAYEIAMVSYDAPPELLENILVGLNRLKPGEYQRVGKLIEKPIAGHTYQQGRMLSTGRMAYELHPEETDPDRSEEKSKENATKKIAPHEKSREALTPGKEVG